MRILDLMRITSRSKLKYLGYSVACAFLAFNSFAYQYVMPGLAFALLGVIFFCICLRKYQRDYLHQQHNRTQQARLENVSTSEMQPTPQVVTKGSRRLFVPPPLETDTRRPSSNSKKS